MQIYSREFYSIIYAFEDYKIKIKTSYKIIERKKNKIK